ARAVAEPVRRWCFLDYCPASDSSPNHRAPGLGGHMPAPPQPFPRLEAFFRRRSDDPDSLKVVDFEVITGGYSRAMSKVFVEDSSGRRGYIIPAAPPPRHAIIHTARE